MYNMTDMVSSVDDALRSGHFPSHMYSFKHGSNHCFCCHLCTMLSTSSALVAHLYTSDKTVHMQ
ncbi:hypothetical protein GLOTRDRAFT_109290 [Gloeophyllum trabeum ATCC 11539]|uniref:Uncharacterized protein n=1 Tax=Gloeophyllum trabeum (strain ATCC 11539 / FP-39264 / Madison 617) TaxID=670483 RepID=S7QNG9_GLOTA|nr:uncharacterized protein GLOTRDRAFT_109290 [Gloeophyllum trabeum ATCC 11539]EPQ61068.1 hypothetical protein GLOTRDRAFT_109290 [Gloeophyllum trabeum ATCC 11539]